MLGLSCTFRPDKFVVLKTPLNRWLQKNIPDKKLRPLMFVYYAIDEGNYVIAHWVTPHKTHFVDVYNIGPHLMDFGQEEAAQLRVMFSDPMTGEDIVKRVKQTEYTKQRNLQDQEEARAERLSNRLSQRHGTGRAMEVR